MLVNSLTKRRAAYLMFLIWPFFTLVFALVNYRSRVSKNIVWLFSAFFGFTFVISSENIDSYVYKTQFLEYVRTFNSFSEFFVLLFEGQVGKGDLYQPLLTFLVSRFTNDYRVLFAIFGLVMGYFFSRNVWFLINKTTCNINKLALPFLILFIFLVPVWHINGVRFYTATHIFVFGVLNFIDSGKKKYLLIILSSFLVHFSFILPILVYFASLVIRHLPSIVYVIILIGSVFIINIEIYQIVPLLPDYYNDRILGYTHEDYITAYEKRKNTAKWFVTLRYDLINYFLIFYSCIILLFDRRQIFQSRYKPIFFFGVLLLGLSNILSIIPSMGRFITVSLFFVVAFAFLYNQTRKILYWHKVLNLLIWIPVLFYCAVEIRLGMDFLGIGSFTYNPITAPFLNNGKSLAQLLGR